MLCASRLAESLGMVAESFTARQKKLLARFSLPVDVPAVDLDVVLKAMQQDKKVAHGKLRFVLPTQMGHVELRDEIDIELVRTAIQA